MSNSKKLGKPAGKSAMLQQTNLFKKEGTGESLVNNENAGAYLFIYLLLLVFLRKQTFVEAVKRTRRKAAKIL